MFRVPLAALGSHCLSAAGVGNAQSALDLTIEAITERSTNYTGLRMRELPGDAAARGPGRRPGGRRTLEHQHGCLDAQRIAKEGRAPTLGEKLRFKRNVAWAMERCTEAVDSLHALAAHIGFSWDAQGGPWALVARGGEFVSPTI